MPDFAVSTAFTFSDSLTPGLAKASGAVDRFGRKTDSIFSRAERRTQGVALSVKNLVRVFGILGALRFLTRGISDASNEFVSFDDSIASATARFKDLDLATTKGQISLKKLRATARLVGRDTEFSAGQAGGGLDFLALAGFNVEQAIISLPKVTDLATVAKLDLARATDIATDTLGAFGLMTKDNIQLQTNLARVNDVLALTTSRTNTTVEQLFEAVGNGAAAMNAAGQSIETFAAFAGTMAGKTIKAGEAGTALRNIVLRLADPTRQAASMLRRLGVSVEDGSGNFRDFLDIIEELQGGLGKLGDRQRAAALSIIFGKKAFTGLESVLSQNIKEIRAFREELEAGGRASNRMAAIMRDSLGPRLMALKSAATEVAFKFFALFRGPLVKAIDSFTETLREVDIVPLAKGLDSFQRGLSVMLDTLRPFKTVLLVAAAGMATYVATMKVIAVWAFVKAITAAAAGVTLFSVALAANPIGAVIAGLTVLVATLVLVRENWDTIKLSFLDGTNFIGQKLRELWADIGEGITSIIFKISQGVFSLADKLTAPLFGLVRAALDLGREFSDFFDLDTSTLDDITDKINSVQESIKAKAELPFVPRSEPIAAAGRSGGRDTVITLDPERAEAEKKRILKLLIEQQKIAQQEVKFNAQINFANTPGGTTAETDTTGAAQVNVDLLGVNP